ncbi:hypothetical protein BC827DRAFT_1154903 [Russula dissimulans]|nr:hypothetical protein BC827DRAFT_1154903 [Russula dissimulans]
MVKFRDPDVVHSHFYLLNYPSCYYSGCDRRAGHPGHDGPNQLQGLRIHGVFLVFAIDCTPNNASRLHAPPADYPVPVIGVLTTGTTQIRAEWVHDSLSGSCGSPNIKSNKLAITATLVTDVALLFTMIIGLLRLRKHGGGRFDLGRLLWKQMFLMPTLITMSIAATRMHRSLADFVFYNNIVNGSDYPPKIDHTISVLYGLTRYRSRGTGWRWSRTFLTSVGQSSASQTGHNVPHMSLDGELGDGPRALNLDNDVESSAE